MAAYTTIDDPSAYFQIALYTGNGTGQTITNDGNSDLQPDFLWFKNRDETVSNILWNSNIGITKFLVSNSTAAEFTNASGYELTSFNTDGFGLGAHNNAGINQSSAYTYVCWQWKANGGTTSSNTDGSITSTVQANTDAGFSIVTWAGTNSTATIGHGLGVAPKVVIIRARDKGVPTSWIMFHKDGSTSDDDYFILQGTFAKNSQAGLFNNQYPSSTVFGVANDFWVNSASTNYLAYCFAEKQGYSKFGKYIGNGNGNGPFVYTGFKPAFVMVKRSDSAGSWFILDTKRSPSNLADLYLSPNANSAESNYLSAFQTDIVSNGFKLRTSYSETNTSGASYIYMAFAENPFVTSTGTPTTAR
jgi:hypothetical protein